MRLGVVAIAVLLLLPLASAAPVDLTVSPAEQSAPLNSNMRFWFTITNNQEFTDEFSLVTDGPHPEWKFPTYIKKVLAAGESFTAPLDFYTSGPAEWAGAFEFTTRTQSLRNPAIAAESRFIINAEPRLKAGIQSVEARYAAGVVEALVAVAFPEARTVGVEVALSDASGVLASARIEQQVSGEALLTVPLESGVLEPGAYAVAVTVDGEQAQAALSILESPSITVITERTPSALFDEVEVRVTNAGNVPVSGYAVEGVAPPGDWLTGNAIAGASCGTDAGGQRCVTTIAMLAPGETETVAYNVGHLMPVQASAGLLVGLAALGFGFMHTSRPRISKRVVARPGRHSIILEVRNPRRHTSNVVVRDHVSPLAHVVQEEFEPVKPVVNRTDSGTELIWKLGAMKPRETRMLSYKVKPLVADSVRLGKARMHYQDKRGKQGVHHSSDAEIAG